MKIMTTLIPRLLTLTKINVNTNYTNKTHSPHTDYTKLSYPLLKKFSELQETKSITVRGDQL